jgi:hypothetical protein
MHCSKWHRYSITSASCWRCNGTSRSKAFAGFHIDHGGEESSTARVFKVSQN